MQTLRAGSASVIRTAARTRIPGISLAKRAAVFALRYLGLVARVDLVRGGTMFVDLANAVGRTIWLRRDYASESAITGILLQRLRPGDVFLDVGANVGFFSVVAARVVGPTGRVVAFEPLPSVAKLLRRTAAANGFKNMEVVEAAVARSSGEASIAALPDTAYSHLIDGAREVDSSHGQWHAFRVKTVSLDDYVGRHIGNTPRLIKMDIEGTELEALAGAQRILSAPDAPDVICEVGSAHLARFNHVPAEVFARFAELGYRAFHPATRQAMSVEDLSVHEYNVLFTRNDPT